MGFLVLISVTLIVVAWVKVGPIAGVAAVVWFAFIALITSRPGASLFGAGPYSSPTRRSTAGPADQTADRHDASEPTSGP